MTHIVFWLGRSKAPWNHLTALEEGCGGSELATLRLTAGLAARGYQVTVYADILDTDAPGTNPRWMPYQAVDERDVGTCNLLVSSRDAVHPPMGVSRRLTWLWMHDLHIGADWGKNISRGFDKVICLSLFAHKRFCEYYPQVDPHKVEVIPNGIDRDLFKLGRAYKAGECFLSNDPSHLPSLKLLAKHRRLEAGEEPLSVIWSSCPDRGLDRVIDLWPGIREAFPGAKLRVFGDALVWAQEAQRTGTRDQVSDARALINTIVKTNAKNNGVIFEGRAGQGMLAGAFMKAHLWLYPTSFEETSCITAMEAQAAGCKVICTPVGALLDTAPYAEFLSPWLPTSIWRNVATQTIKVALQFTNEATLCNARARVPTWDHVADRWAAMIERDLRKKVDP